LAPQPSLGLGPLKIRLNFLEASQQFSFLEGRVVSPTHNPHPEKHGFKIWTGFNWLGVETSGSVPWIHNESSAFIRSTDLLNIRPRKHLYPGVTIFK
jgi:hypothetical protein